MEMDNTRWKGLALCHGTDRQTLMQSLDDDKDAGALFVREGSHRRLNLQGCGGRLLMPTYYL